MSAAAGARERNPRGHGARLRTDIVAAAAGLLDETGSEDAVTLRAVARRVGIAAPSIYGHFADRQAILLAVVQEAFAELDAALRSAAAQDADPVQRLHTVCAAYLEVAAARPQRYRVMFGGLWSGEQAVAGGDVTAEQVADLGREALGVLMSALQGCVDAGSSSSTDVGADAVALWLGLHGLAHQRAVSPGFPWPADIDERVIGSLARLAASSA